MNHYHSYAAQKNSKSHDPKKNKRAKKDQKGGDPRQPVGLKYSKNQTDQMNTSTFELPKDPKKGEVGEFRDGCFVISAADTSRPSNCIELARPKLKTQEKDLQIRDFKDGYFQLRNGSKAKPAKAKPVAAATAASSAPALWTPDDLKKAHMKKATSSQSKPILQQTRPISVQQAPQHPMMYPSGPQMAAPFGQPMMQPYPIQSSAPASTVSYMPQHFQSMPMVPTYAHQVPQMPQHRPPVQQVHAGHMVGSQMPSQPQQVPGAQSFSFQNFVQECSASSVPFKPPPAFQTHHASDLVKPKGQSSNPAPAQAPSPSKKKGKNKNKNKKAKSQPAKSPRKRSNSPPVAHAKWAGGGYSNSPHPSLLPAPVF